MSTIRLLRSVRHLKLENSRICDSQGFLWRLAGLGKMRKLRGTYVSGRTVRCIQRDMCRHCNGCTFLRWCTGHRRYLHRDAPSRVLCQTLTPMMAIMQIWLHTAHIPTHMHTLYTCTLSKAIRFTRDRCINISECSAFKLQEIGAGKSYRFLIKLLGLLGFLVS